MALETISVWVCDNPKCGRQRDPIDGPGTRAIGYTMSVVRDRQWGGGEGGEVYACSERCIRPAIVAVCDRSLEQ